VNIKRLLASQYLGQYEFVRRKVSSQRSVRSDSRSVLGGVERRRRGDRSLLQRIAHTGISLVSRHDKCPGSGQKRQSPHGAPPSEQSGEGLSCSANQSWMPRLSGRACWPPASPVGSARTPSPVSDPNRSLTRVSARRARPPGVAKSAGVLHPPNGT
jgi:hypothetical protein